MFHRIPHLLSLCLVFGSMWLQGVLPMPATDDHGMTGPTCLEHCLDAVHINEANEGVAVVGIDIAAPQMMEVIFPSSDLVRETSIDSHHDPSRILTTIKRE